MKKVFAILLCVTLILSLGVTGFSAGAETVKAYYSDFENGIGTDPTATGYGENTAYVMTTYGLTYECVDGALHLNMTNGNYIRMMNTMTDIPSYKYMVVKMKGTSDWGEGLTGNSIAFWFGSYGTPGAKLYVPAEQLTADYSEVIIELPTGYFDSIADDYKSGLFITTERGANFDITIDEIYFRNDETTEEEPVEEVKEKVYFNDFNSGLSAEPTATGYGENTAYVLGVDGATYTCSDGVLNIKLTNGNYLRIQNTMTDVADYKYMVVKMKGTSDWGEGLTGNSIAFWFGSYGTPGAKLYVPAEQLTADYSEVIIELPTGYFDSIADDYKACLFITTERGANFDITIDEIYFRNDEVPAVQEVKAVYNDFNSGLSSEPSATGNGDNTAYVLGVDGATYTCTDGALNLKLTNGNYLRIQNTMTGISDYKYMVVKMKGTSDWGEGLTGNSIAFWFGSYGTPGAKLYVPAEQLTADYSEVVIALPEGYFDSIGDDYKSCLFITTERGANFDITIDEIYFRNDVKSDYQSGDIDMNGSVNVTDLIRIKKIIAGVADATVTADINGDSVIDATDLVAVKKILLGI